MAHDKKTIRRQIQLTFWKSVRMAWQSIRVRLFRSILVVSGIVLALAFLTYILSADALLRAVAFDGPPELKAELERQGVLADLADEDAAIQTRWMAALALMISFVGILNAMLLSVTERFHEIGTMKCLGALDSFIVRLFLLESVNVRLRPRLFAQLKPGTRVVSNSFNMRDWKPDKQISHPKAFSNVIYFWAIPAHVGGTWTWQNKLTGKQIPDSLKLEQEFQAVQGAVKSSDGAEVPITAGDGLNAVRLSYAGELAIQTQQVVDMQHV